MAIGPKPCLTLRWLCAGALAVVLALGGLPPGAARAAASYSVLQVNICNGGHDRACYTGRASEGTGDLINARTPSVVTVNEMCASDLEPIRIRTGYAGVFTQSGSQTCTDGTAYGNAILFPAGTSVGTPERLTYQSQSSRTELRTLTCVPAAEVTACVTHLSPNPVKADQGAEMRDAVGPHAGRGATVLGGDWNMTYGGTPNAQDYVPAGMFREDDGAVQHVIASSAHFGFERTQVIELDWTDHPAMQVYLTR
jgi:hypothetical protein